MKPKTSQFAYVRPTHGHVNLNQHAPRYAHRNTKRLKTRSSQKSAAIKSYEE